MAKASFDIQHLTVSTDEWKVALNYESWSSNTKMIKTKENDMVIELSKKGEWDSTLKIEVSNYLEKRTCIVIGIQGGAYLHTKGNRSEGQSVKIINDDLILSLGLNFISIDLKTLKLNWMLQPDEIQVFEFYDLDNDYLLHGEIGIYRIDKAGKIKWTYSGADIWVNMEGLPEVEITDSTIKLLDFYSNEYEIDFNGKEIIN